MRQILLACFISVLAGCAQVEGNYPTSSTEAPKRTIDPESALSVSTPEFTIRVGKIWDRSRLQAEKAQTHQQMREGMGDAAFESMIAQVNATNPWVARFDTFSTHTFYRGAIELHTDDSVILDRGFLLLTMVTGRDTVTVRDDGIAFFKHDASPLQVLFTHDGPILYERGFNGLPLGAENRCNILVLVQGRVIDVVLDPKRYQVQRP